MSTSGGTRKRDKYVTVIIDLTGIRDGTGPARLLDMVEGRSKRVFKSWLADRPQAWRDAVEVVAMDGFTGFQTATSEGLPEAVAVIHRFHVVRLATEAPDGRRRRVQQDTCGHRGHAGDPLYASRRTLHTGVDLLIDKQKAKLTATFATDRHLPVEVSWNIYQDMIAGHKWVMFERFETNVVDLAGEHGVLGQTAGRTETAVTAWLDAGGQAWKDTVQIVAMNPRASYRAAVRKALPQARIVADYLHLVRLADQAVTDVRRRGTWDTEGRRGRKTDPA